MPIMPAVRRPMPMFAWLAALALLVAACAPAAPEATPTLEPTPTPAATPDDDPDNGDDDPPPAGEETVEISGFAFQPSELTISVGTTVTFVNNDGSPHTATHGRGGATADNPFFDERLAAGASASVTFDQPGTYEVTCTFHPAMNMTIVVEG
jgi:plastocyanin